MTGGDEGLSVGRKRQTVNPAAMARKGLQGLAGLCIPNDDRLIVTGGSEILPLRVEGDSENRLRMFGQGPSGPALLHVPNVDQPPPTRSGQLPAVAAEAEGTDRSQLARGHRRTNLAGGRVDDAHCAFGVSRSHILAVRAVGN